MSEASEAEKFKNEGNKAMQAGDLDLAIEQYSLGINVDDQNHILYSNRCAVYAKKGMWSEALADGTRCVFLKPDWAKGYLRKGQALQALGRYKEAQFCYQKGSQLDPNDQQLKQGLMQVNMLAFQQTQEEAAEKKRQEEEALKNPKPIEPEPPKKPTIADLRVDLGKMTVKELKAILAAKKIPSDDCFEKEDLIDKIVKHGAYERPDPAAEKPAEAPKPKKKREPKPAEAANETQTTAKPEKATTKKSIKGEPADAKPPAKNGKPAEPADPKPKKPRAKDGGAESEKKPAKENTERTETSKKKKDEAKGGDDDDINYYKLLGVEKTATPAEIKKAYYKAAQQCHPDKTDDPGAEEQFKLISEAYGVLMDEEKRKLYDKYGRKRVQEMEGGADPTVIFKMIFGAGAFDDTFGELLFVQAMSPEFQSKFEGKTEDEVRMMMKAETATIVAGLAELLISKLAAREKGEDKKFASLADDIQDKCDAPGGPALLEAVGYIYVSEAKIRMGRPFESQWAKADRLNHNINATVGLVNSAMKMQDIEDGRVDEEKAAERVLDALWRYGQMEIEKLCRKVCKEIFDKSKYKFKKDKRGKALLQLGELYQKSAKKAKKDKGLDKGTFFEAAAKEAASEKASEGADAKPAETGEKKSNK